METATSHALLLYTVLQANSAKGPVRNSVTADRIPPTPEPRLDGLPDLNTSRALRAASGARREAAQADLAELELAAKRGRLIDADQARADVIAAYSVVKTRLLAVPSRVAQRLPHVARAVVPVVDELIREALEELSAER